MNRNKAARIIQIVFRKKRSVAASLAQHERNFPNNNVMRAVLAAEALAQHQRNFPNANVNRALRQLGRNTGLKNWRGRPIYEGPQGGTYVYKNGKKEYSFAPGVPNLEGALSTPQQHQNRARYRNGIDTGLRNTRNRPVLEGPKGGRYVMVNGRKTYKFTLAHAPLSSPVS